MEYAYLNVFVNALSRLFEVIFEDIFSPILSDILQVFSNFFVNVIWNLLSEYLIGLFVALCSLVDFIESVFNVFAGLAPVYYQTTNPETNQKVLKTMSLLDVLFDMEAITLAFWVITLAAMGICVIFTIYKTAKSISDMTLEDKNPISKVLGDAMKAGVTFLLIPFLCVMMLQLSSTVTRQAQLSFNEAQGGDTSIGTILFLSATLDADKNTTGPKDLITGVIELSPGRMPSFDDSIRKPYMQDPTRYQNLKQVRSDFYASNVNYIVGFTSAIVILIILLLAIITFVRRLFELLLLYIVSPLFVSTIPLDDGITFARWREMFIAKFFSGFGMIFAMKYYLMIVPLISTSGLVLYPKDTSGGAMINNILQIFLIIGGAWAVFKSQSLILELLNPEAAQAEKQASALLTGAVMGSVHTAAAIATGGSTAALSAVGAVAGGAGGAVGGAAAGEGQGGGKTSSPKAERDKDEKQAYRG